MSAVVALVLGLTAPLHAAPVFYADSAAVPPGVMFTGVFESSGTDPVPLYGPPEYFTTGIDFDPAAFVSTANGGASDITDGQLNFTVESTDPLVGINSLNLTEAGDYSLLGSGTSATQAIAGAILRVTVTEINGVPVAPILLVPSNASVAFNLAANPGIVQPWSLGTSVNVAGQLPAGSRATEVEVSINNQLATFSQAASAAFIAKKEFVVNVAAVAVPEPAGFALLALAGLAACRRRRCL